VGRRDIQQILDVLRLTKVLEVLDVGDEGRVVEVFVDREVVDVERVA